MMGGLTNPALMVLGKSPLGQDALNFANPWIKAGKEIDGLLGVSKSKSNKRERRLLREQQAAEGADLNARQAADLDELSTRNNVARQRIQADAESADRKRARALRQETGSLRAQLGAQGISSADGSGEAVILGRQKMAEEEKSDAERQDALKLSTLSDEETALKRRNLLDLTRQQERQRLEWLARKT